MSEPADTYQATYRGTFQTHRGGVSVDEAAQALGVAPSTIRRWVKTGRLTSERVSRPQGYVVLVQLPDAVGPTTEGDSPSQQLPTAAPSQISTAPAIAARGEVERAEAMASYAAMLTAPLVKQITDQAEQLGRLAAELEQARATIVALQVPREEQEIGTTLSPVSPVDQVEPPARRWWQRLLWGS
jgi:excisionase family DNA binding protein